MFTEILAMNIYQDTNYNVILVLFRRAHNSYDLGDTDTKETLIMSVEPSPFSGPEHLSRLNYRCFDLELDT